jgi:PmbA protein
MKRSERRDLAQWVMERALKHGADQAAVTLSNSREIQVEYRDGQLDQLRESTRNSLHLDVYLDHRYSGHTTNDIRRDALETFVAEAVAGTKYLTEDEYRSLPDPRYYPKGDGADLKIRDAGHERIDSADRVRMAAEIQEAASARDDRIISTTSGYADSIDMMVRIHSNGFLGERESTIYRAGAEVTMKGEGEGRPMDYHYVRSRHHGELPDPETIAKAAVDRAARKIGQRKIASGRYEMLVENRAAARLIGILQGPMSARALQQKNSFLEGALGRPIASEAFTMIDDPFIEKGFGSRHFDGEGLAARRRVMIERGVLRSYYVDYYYGRKLGMEPTSGSTSNLVFGTGTRSLEEMIRGLDRAILVTDFIGGNSNSTTGDFSFGLVGQWIEKGKIVRPVNEMNISGNAMEFWNRLVETGDDPWPYSPWRRPSLLFEGVDFSGI